jgi:hypothetical protein
MMKTNHPALIKALAIIGLAALLAAGCVTRIPAHGGFKESTLRAWYVPAEGAGERKAVPYEHVEFLLEKPTARKFLIIGYFVPTTWKLMGSTAQAVTGARAAASLYGGDAVYFVDPKENRTFTKYTAAVIVWE